MSRPEKSTGRGGRVYGGYKRKQGAAVCRSLQEARLQGLSIQHSQASPFLGRLIVFLTISSFILALK